VAQVKDELMVVGEFITDSELVRISLNGFTKEWEVFLKCVVGCEHLPDWIRLWDDFTQEEIQERYQSSEVFLYFTEIGHGQQVVNGGGMVKVVHGVGNVRFQLAFGELVELDGVLFVPCLRVNLLLVSSLEDVGYCVLFKREHVFIYRQGVDPVELQLIDNRVDMLYMLRGQPSVYDSASDEEHEEASKIAVAPRI
jgi:hypothetical protein